MTRCHSTLADLRSGDFSRAALRRLSESRRIHPVLPFCRADLPCGETGSRASHLSISGVQDKFGLVLRRGVLQLADRDSEYILKPIPSLPVPKYASDIPANEHATMQIAEQVFGIRTAANALVFFRDGEPAYLTRRFDRQNGRKIHQEDFCQLSSRTPASHGENYKYNGSYEETYAVLRSFCPSYRIESRRLFLQILFSYAFSNGDAHLKNFSLQEGPSGDYVLTPAYDLLATSLHFPSESACALPFFADGHFTEAYEALGFYSSADFLELGRRFELDESEIRAFLLRFQNAQAHVHALLQRSFLSPPAQEDYWNRFLNRLLALRQ